MKTIHWSLLLAMTFILTVACEGEPPMTPADLPAPPAASAEATVEEAPSAVPARTAPPPSPAAASTVTAPAASAEAASSASPTGAAPPPPSVTAHGSIAGKVLATPANMSQYAVVWLDDGPPDTAPPKNVSVDNRRMSFIPFVQVAPVGAKVVFSNGDPFPHNVFTPDNERFNLGNIGQHAAAVRVFKAPAQYSLLCNLHPGMLGYLIVTPSSWFSKVAKDGSFTIKDVPAGTYKVTAWAPRNAPITQSVTVKDGDVTVGFELHR